MVVDYIGFVYILLVIVNHVRFDVVFVAVSAYEERTVT